MLKMFVLVLLLSVTSITSYKFLPESEEKFSYKYSRNKHVVRISDIPHQVLVAYNTEYCSGSLIFSRIVVTVASCFIGNSDKCVVKVGADTITGLGQVIAVLEKKIHEYYQHEVPYNNDIALLILERNVNFGSNVKKVVIIEPEVTVRVGTTLDVAGWGGSNLQVKYVNRLLLSEMKVTSDEECYAKYGKLKTASRFCAKYQPERRLSDNGGSALYRDRSVDILVGILTYGATYSEETDCVALFTNVSYFHRWIMVNSERLLKKYCVEEKSYYFSYEYNDTDEIYEYENQQQYL